MRQVVALYAVFGTACVWIFILLRCTYTFMQLKQYTRHTSQKRCGGALTYKFTTNPINLFMYHLFY